MKQKKTNRYYWFDYLFWIFKKTEVFYGGGRCPDPDLLFFSFFLAFVYVPLMIVLSFLLPWHVVGIIMLLFGGVASIGVFGLGFLNLIYPPSRQKLVMKHYEGRFFSRYIAYLILFFMYGLCIGEVFLCAYLFW
ncbi:hypothetical protein [uncultured Bacteroides sp.]|uniref:hypothetical protein n=1 Tax=uncultured Bacteroides sp. TaxID=162156 RepID=UPI00262E6E30|nr:hypothetical protein [uncultured Bacteroides sp.]